MNAATFQFSNTAKSYVEHLDLLLVGKESESKKVEELMAENSSVIQAMQDKTTPTQNKLHNLCTSCEKCRVES